MHAGDSHKPVKVDQARLKDGFAFHPRLAGWLMSALKLSGDEVIVVYEAGCTEESCPVEETILEIGSASGETMKLKIGRSKDRISKNDLYFAIQKQLGSG